MMTIIIQIEQRDRRSSCWSLSNNPNTCRILHKVVSPLFLTRIEDWYDLLCAWVTSLTAVTTTFIAIAAR